MGPTKLLSDHPISVLVIEEHRAVESSIKSGFQVFHFFDAWAFLTNTV
jgi:hypothetical protein